MLDEIRKRRFSCFYEVVSFDRLVEVRFVTTFDEAKIEMNRFKRDEKGDFIQMKVRCEQTAAEKDFECEGQVRVMLVAFVR